MRYQRTALRTATVSITRSSPQSVPPAVPLDLGVEPREVRVVGGELLILVVGRVRRAGLDGPDPGDPRGQVGIAVRVGVGAVRHAAALDPELIPDRPSPEDHGKA